MNPLWVGTAAARGSTAPMSNRMRFEPTVWNAGAMPPTGVDWGRSAPAPVDGAAVSAAVDPAVNTDAGTIIAATSAAQSAPVNLPRALIQPSPAPLMRNAF